MNTIDILEYGLKALGMAVQKSRMDVRMGVSIMIKIIFFALWFLQSGDSKYMGGHFATTLITWVVFHVYIIFIELSYIVEGANIIKMRKQSYKIIDSVQSGILIIYFSVQVYQYQIQTAFNMITLISLFIDIALNFDQLLKFIEKEKLFLQKQQYKKNNSDDNEEVIVTGGEITFYISIMIGGGLGLFVVIIMLSELQNKPELEAFPFYVWSLYLCMIGEGIFIIFVMYFLIPQAKTPRTDQIDTTKSFCGCSPSKHFLCLMYGICIGLFSLYYAFFLGIYGLYKFIFKVLECIGWLHKNSQSQVHPAR
ncbi:unnamed protein product [Paramecium pentaurelia]|uniref:Transmembrane protein n=1 Tax=Paramecium pentaurelia TaxID=43138 RepID=A0A8S1YFU8_9CILI|nr:unnamed protein product [Paramecium pentaurelia]